MSSRTGIDERAQAPAADVNVVGPHAPCWDQVRGRAEEMLASGEGRAAFGLVLAHWLNMETEESRRFLCERFRQTPLRFSMVMVQGIGNMVMMTPAIRALKAAFPACELEVVGHRPALDVVEGWELVSTVTEAGDWNPVRELDALLLSMWSGSFQKAYADTLKASPYPFLAVRFDDAERHEAEFHLDMVRALGQEGELPTAYCRTEPVPWPFAGEGPVALLADTTNPGEEWRRKRWPHFPELARRLLEMGYQVGLVGGPVEAERFDPALWPERLVDLQGKYSVPQTACLLERADLLVANDSGPAHMAAAVGTRVYALFGGTLESKNRPLGPNVRVITSDLGCRPCQYLPSWAGCKDNKCMRRISVEQVLAAIAGRGRVVREKPRPEAQAGSEGLVKVDLGCGRFKRRGYIGIDLDPDGGADIVCDITQGIPLETDSVDRVNADNLLEHIGDGFTDVMNEIWRVCKPDGQVEITVPLFPREKAVSDPTHRRYFTEHTFSYFDCNSSQWQLFGSSYGFKPFRILSQRAFFGELEVIMAPAKDVEPPVKVEPAEGGRERPRVLFLSHNQPHAGGGENAMHSVANRLARLGYCVTVAYNAAPFIHDRPVESPPDAAYSVRWVEGPSLEEFRRASAELVREAAGGIDICMPLWRANSSELIDACKAAGASVGMWCQNVNYAPERRNTSVFRASDFIVVVTPYGRIMLRDRFGRGEGVYVIPNAGADEFFESYRERSTERMERFVFFGRLADEQKGLSTLCEALDAYRSTVREFAIDIIGDGPDLPAMRSRIGSLDLGEHVRFLGWMGSEELARVLPDYDLCILPSNFEACSLAAIETMAAGVPLITTAVGGNPWLLKPQKHGLLVPPRSPQALAEAMKWAHDHPAEMNLMARWAHRRALKRYHWDRVGRDYCLLFQRIRALKPDAAAR